jgi:hypothetical protein
VERPRISSGSVLNTISLLALKARQSGVALTARRLL